jgi:hypothetical protein
MFAAVAMSEASSRWELRVESCVGILVESTLMDSANKFSPRKPLRPEWEPHKTNVSTD